MNEENTKAAAHAGSYGMKLLFTSPGIDGGELADLIIGAVRSIGDEIGRRRKMLIGHVKVFISVPGGSLQVNMVDLDLGPEKNDRLPADKITEGEIRLMAAVVGLDDATLEQIIQNGLGPLRHKLEMDIMAHMHEH